MLVLGQPQVPFSASSVPPSENQIASSNMEKKGKDSYPNALFPGTSASILRFLNLN